MLMQIIKGRRGSHIVLLEISLGLELLNLTDHALHELTTE